MSNLSISERQVRDVAIVDLEGKITLGESNRQLHGAIRRLVSEQKERIILNLAKVTTIDSSGLGEIVAAYSTVAANGGSLKLINLSDKVTDIMTITKLYTVFDIYGTETEGIDSFDPKSDLAEQPPEEGKAAEARPGGSLW